jgi:hypothetical protein
VRLRVRTGSGPIRLVATERRAERARQVRRDDADRGVWDPGGGTDAAESAGDT